MLSRLALEVHPTFFPMSTGGCIPGCKGDKGVLLTTQPNYVPRSKDVDLYVIRGVVLV
jgi:hypothetical protein